MKLHKDTRPIELIDRENLESNKLFLQYPIPKICNLRCPYCFHQDFFQKKPDVMKYAYILGFTIKEFEEWMETHVYNNFDEIIIHFSGGEPFFYNNRELVFDLIDLLKDKNIKFDILSNGLFNRSIIRRLEERKEQILRIGLTYHRLVIEDNDNLYSKFQENVISLISSGIDVYVKEIFHKDRLVDILKHRNYWNNIGVNFKIQDFQNLDGYPVGYTDKDISVIDDEYKHQGHFCSCRQGFRSISIRGYDIAAGEVIACWLDPKIIGNISKNTLNLNFRVEIDTSIGRRNVTGGNFRYSENGTNERDRKKCEH